MRRPKRKGVVDLSSYISVCPFCGTTMIKQPRPDMMGWHWVCLNIQCQPPADKEG